MRIHPALLLCLVLPLACSGDDPDTASVAGHSPEETFETFRRAALDGDWDLAYRLVAPAERSEWEEDWALYRRSLSDWMDRSLVSGRGLRFPPPKMVAEALGVTQERVLSMTLEEVHRSFYALQEFDREAATSVRIARVVRDADSPDRCTLVLDQQSEGISMVAEGGRWYFSGPLEDLFTAIAGPPVEGVEEEED